MNTVWTVLPAEDRPGERFVGYDEWVLQQTLLPEGLFRLDSPAGETGRAALFQSGAQLIEMRMEGATVACDAVSRRGKLMGASQYCFVDYERDGRFDGMFPVLNISKGGGLPTVQGSYPKKVKTIMSVPYSRIEPTQIETRYFVGIRNAGKAALYDWQNFQVCYGSEAATDCLTSYNRTSASIFPSSLSILGARVTVVERNESKVKVRVDSTMPSQPFGIVSTYELR